MEMRKIVDYIRENVRTYGMGATLHDIECRMVNKIVHFEILKGMTVRMQDVKDPGLFEAQGFDARFVGEDELARFAHDGAHDVSLDFLRRARARGDRCYALFDGEALAAYGWYSGLPTPIDEPFVLHFDPAWTYMYKGYTVPAYRGTRRHAVGMCWVRRGCGCWAEPLDAGLGVSKTKRLSTQWGWLRPPSYEDTGTMSHPNPLSARLD